MPAAIDGEILPRITKEMYFPSGMICCDCTGDLTGEFAFVVPDGRGVQCRSCFEVEENESGWFE